MSGKKYNKRRQSNKGLTVLMGICVAALLVLISFFAFQVDDYEVQGNYHETENEIIESLMEGTLGHNALYLSLTNRERKIEGNSFIDTITVRMKTPRSIEVVVKEKALVGYVFFDDLYWYFDRMGVVRALSKYSQADFNLMARGLMPAIQATVENTAASESDAGAPDKEGVNMTVTPSVPQDLVSSGDGAPGEAETSDGAGETEEDTASRSNQAEEPRAGEASDGNDLSRETVSEETGGPETDEAQGGDGPTGEAASEGTGGPETDETQGGDGLTGEAASKGTGDPETDEAQGEGDKTDGALSEESGGPEGGQSSEGDTAEEEARPVDNEDGQREDEVSEEAGEGGEAYDGEGEVIAPREIAAASFMGRILPRAYMEGAGAFGAAFRTISFENEEGTEVIAPIVIEEGNNESLGEGNESEEAGDEPLAGDDESEEGSNKSPAGVDASESGSDASESGSDASESGSDAPQAGGDAPEVAGQESGEDAPERTEEKTDSYETLARSTEEDLLRSESGEILVYIPLIEGLSFSQIEVGQILQGQSSRLFDMLGAFCEYAVKTGNIPDRILVGENQGLSVFYGGAEVRLGTGDDLDVRLNELRYIDPYLENLTGVLHLENFDGSQDEVIFSKK